MLFVDLWGEVYSAAECSLVNIVSYTLLSFELAILNVLYSFQDFSKQKLCIKSKILLHVKKGNYMGTVRYSYQALRSSKHGRILYKTSCFS